MHTFRLEGWWFGYQRTTSLSRVPFLGTVEAVAEAVSRIEIRPAGDGVDGWVARWEVLSLTVDSGSRWVKTTLPEPVVRSMPVLERPIQEASAGLYWPRATTVTGARLQDPVQEALPTRMDDSRLVAIDSMGRGARIEVSGMVRGHLQVVQRAWSTLVSVPTGPSEMVARVRWGVEQSVLGASHVALRKPPASTPTDDPARNHAVFHRASGPADARALEAANAYRGRALATDLLQRLTSVPAVDVSQEA